MTQSRAVPDLDRLLRLRLVVARHGEMDAARWWNTNGLLGSRGALLMSRGFPKTHRFAQARVVFAVAQARSAEIFAPPGCATLWNLPADLEDQFDARWSHWLDERDAWTALFDRLQPPPTDLLATLKDLGLLSPTQEARVNSLRRSAEDRAVPLGTTDHLDDDALTLLAAACSRGEPAKPAIPYLRLGA